MREDAFLVIGNLIRSNKNSLSILLKLVNLVIQMPTEILLLILKQSRIAESTVSCF